MEIIRKEYSVPSKSGVADVFARCWMPADGAMYTALVLGNSVEKLRKKIEKVCR